MNNFWDLALQTHERKNKRSSRVNLTGISATADVRQKCWLSDETDTHVNIKWNRMQIAQDREVRDQQRYKE